LEAVEHPVVERLSGLAQADELVADAEAGCQQHGQESEGQQGEKEQRFDGPQAAYPEALPANAALEKLDGFLSPPALVACSVETDPGGMRVSVVD